jgi:hypothetical protein
MNEILVGLLALHLVSRKSGPRDMTRPAEFKDDALQNPHAEPQNGIGLASVVPGAVLWEPRHWIIRCARHWQWSLRNPCAEPKYPSDLTRKHQYKLHACFKTPWMRDCVTSFAIVNFHKRP